MTPIILLADDDRVVRHLVGAILQRQGYTVENASDVESTVRRACSAPAPQLILLDMHLPDGTGRDILRRLEACEETSTIPVVLLTGSQASALGDMGPRVRAVVTKPVRPAELLEVVGRVLGSPLRAPMG